MTDFKPGDVAMTRHGIGVVVQCRHEAHDRTPHWHYANGGWDELGYTANQARRIVVIDPEDREQVERLMAVYTGEAVKRGAISFAGYADKRADSMRAALREFASPTPPRPDEPTGLYAVVIDDEGNAWHRNHDCDSKKPWRKATGFWFTWDDISVSSDDQIKFRGVTP